MAQATAYARSFSARKKHKKKVVLCVRASTCTWHDKWKKILHGGLSWLKTLPPKCYFSDGIPEGHGSGRNLRLGCKSSEEGKEPEPPQIMCNAAPRRGQQSKRVPFCQADSK